MRSIVRPLTIVSAAILVAACTQTPLNTGKYLGENRINHSQNVGSFPVNMILTPNGKFALTTDIGFRQSIWAISTADGAGHGHVPFANKAGDAEQGDPRTLPPERTRKSNGLYYGLAAAADGTIYAGQGAQDAVAILHLNTDGKLEPQGSILTKPGDFPAGVALDDGGHLFVSNQSAGGNNPFKTSGSLAVYDIAAKKELGRFTFSDSFMGTTNFPLAVCALRDGSRAYVASERDNAVYVIHCTTPQAPALTHTIPVGDHPVSMIMDKAQKRLFVANADSDTVSVIDTATDTVTDTILVRPPALKQIPGCTPTGLTLSADESQLYVTLADINAVAVVDFGPVKWHAGVLKGFIPVGWYPTAIAAAPDGKHLLVANAKGNTVRTPTVKKDPVTGKFEKAGSPLNLLEGNVQSIDIPAYGDLPDLTAKVLKNNRIDTLATQTNPLAPIAMKAGGITHVIYIIKENRTYDQILGDLPQGNGDPKLCLFGRDVTPNLHALAERFVLLDNLYTCGEVSGDGWCWSTQAMANAYVERNVPYNYSGRGRKFDFEGQNNGYPTGGFPATLDGQPTSKNSAMKDGGKAIPDVGAAPGGHLWDLCNAAGISFRNYGFFQYFADADAGVTGGPDNYATVPGLQPSAHDLQGLTDIDYRRFDLDFADSDAPTDYYKKTSDRDFLFPMKSYGKHASTSRFAEWNREFKMYLDKAPDGSAVPALMFVRMGNDHTEGASSGKHTPRAEVADNDYAVGQLVDAISHSPIWPHTAIVVIEDDAQDGPDHVDCHRSTGYVISPFIKKGTVDHRFYNTVSFIKTMEQILGLPPMNQYDATSGGVLCFSDKPINAEPFTAIKPDKALIRERNPSKSSLLPTDPRRDLAVRSDAMDFVHADAAPAGELNEIIWRTVKGPTATPPASKSSSMGQKDDDEDDD